MVPNSPGDTGPGRNEYRNGMAIGGKRIKIKTLRDENPGVTYEKGDGSRETTEEREEGD